MGIGDRFMHQGKAQLKAIQKAVEKDCIITPVWNKSYREHQIIHSDPKDTRLEADEAVKVLNWKNEYFVDADHINLKTVDGFIDHCDFFTLDVADYIGQRAKDEDIRSFIEFLRQLIGIIDIPGLKEPLVISRDLIQYTAELYLFAIQEAGRIHQRIKEKKSNNNYIIEVSMDETKHPQKPVELLIILAAIAWEGIPAQTIAPKFSGRFNKGVEYVGDIQQFSEEFRQDLAVVDYAIDKFLLMGNLKLSIHSGSDKFAIYKPINDALKDFDAGLHLKTAGTTWLEELIGLAEAGGGGLELAKEIYRQAFVKREALCKPYATVIDIKYEQLPDPEIVNSWNSEKFATTLRHDQSHENYNLHFRQLLHVGYKVAVEMGDRFYYALDKYEDVISQNVTENLWERHIKKVFL